VYLTEFGRYCYWRIKIKRGSCKNLSRAPFRKMPEAGLKIAQKALKNTFFVKILPRHLVWLGYLGFCGGSTPPPKPPTRMYDKDAHSEFSEFRLTFRTREVAESYLQNSDLCRERTCWNFHKTEILQFQQTGTPERKMLFVQNRRTNILQKMLSLTWRRNSKAYINVVWKRNLADSGLVLSLVRFGVLYKMAMILMIRFEQAGW